MYQRQKLRAKRRKRVSLSEKEVQHIAKLAALQLSDQEVKHYQQELNQILSYVEQLSAVNTEGVAPTSHVHGAINGFRKDIVKPSLDREDLRKIAPDFCADGFRVPKIIS